MSTLSSTSTFAGTPLAAARDRRITRLYGIAALLISLAAAALLVDISLSKFAHDSRHARRGDLRKYLEMHECFAHTAGIGTILLAVVVLDPTRRRAVWRLVGGILLAGTGNLLVKLSIGRVRPHDFPGGTFPDRVSETFTTLFPFLHAHTVSEGLRSTIQSFPSGHAATAAAFAVGLSRIYPRGRWLFAFLAAVSMLQRIECGAHFLSDVLAGAAIGCLAAGLCGDRRVFGRMYDKIEGKVWPYRLAPCTTGLVPVDK